MICRVMVLAPFLPYRFYFYAVLSLSIGCSPSDEWTQGYYVVGRFRVITGRKCGVSRTNRVCVNGKQESSDMTHCQGAV